MHQLGLDQVIDNAAHALRAGNLDLAEQVLMPALDQKPDVAALWFYVGTLFAHRGMQAVGMRCLQVSYELEPNPSVIANMATCLREMQQTQLTQAVLRYGLERAPWDVHIRANLCGSYVQGGDPLPGIEYGTPIANDSSVGAAVKFNLGLLHLEAGHLVEGFEYYATGNHRGREERVYDPDPPKLTREMHEGFLRACA